MSESPDAMAYLNAFERDRTPLGKDAEIEKLQARIAELEKKKRVKIKNKKAVTEKGVFLLAVDKDRIYTRKRHTNADDAKTECKRLAKDLHERVLILQVVAVLDKRPGGAE